MTRKVPSTPTPKRPLVQPSEEHIQLALRGAVVLMAPVVRWLLRHGVSYGSFADRLKTVFVGAAREELERSGSKTTVSALSVLSGVHRKDVRALVEAGSAAADPDPEGSRSVPLASQVFTRWITDKVYRDRSGKALPLPRAGAKRSFEALCTGISTDVHPRTVLAELVRLGLARVDAETDVVVPMSAAFIPSRHLDEMTSLFAIRVADHVAAAVHNLTMPGPKFLERSAWADGLSADSAVRLHEVSREAWERAFETVVEQARERVTADAVNGDSANHRIRFGVYFFSEPVRGGAARQPASAPAPRTSARKTAPAAKDGRHKTRRIS